jgi:heme-degrading monooxygenase HmoA
MYARLSRFAGLDPERIDETVRQFEEEQLPRLEQLAGFRGITVGVNHTAGQALSIALWESEAAMRESEKIATEARDRAVATAGPVRTPVVDNYEVVIHREATSGSPAS